MTPIPPPSPVSRRNAIATLAVAGGGVIFGVPLAIAQQTKTDYGPGGPAEAFKYWLKIGADNSVTVNVHMAEMGQGVTTALPQIVAEELGADWKDVRFEFPLNGKAYYNRGYGGGFTEGTGGSVSIRGQFQMFRELGATAREMFKSAAASKLKVPASSLTAEHGHIVHAASGRSLSFADLADAAARQSPPKDVALKPKAQWTLIGTSAARLDTPAKVDGSAGFGVDVMLPDMLVATIQAAPVFTARLLSVDPAPAMKIPGVHQVVALDNAVAVVASAYWPALRGLKALAPVWDTPARAHYGASDLALDLETALNRANTPVLQSVGDVDGAMKAATNTAAFEYSVPYLTHACMEPMNATAHVRADSVDIWMPGQGHTTVIEGVAKALSIDPLSIQVHRTFLGGGFGRRGEGDVAVQAALIAKQVGRPVKLIWSREEDIRQDFYRPAAKMRIMAGLDANNLPVALDISNAVPSISKRRFPDAVKDGKDMSALAAFNDSPYAIAHSRMRFGLVDNGIPVGYWRSVNHSQNVFFRESAINELAARAKQDGLTFRKALLAGNTRILTLLDALIRLAVFDKPMAAGMPGTRRGRGAALSASHGSIIAQVVEVSVAADNAITVDRVSCVADVGTIVNPGIVSAQMESSIIDGLSAAMFGGMTPKNGGMAEGNFNELRFMRLAEAPRDSCRGARLARGGARRCGRAGPAVRGPGTDRGPGPSHRRLVAHAAGGQAGI